MYQLIYSLTDSSGTTYPLLNYYADYNGQTIWGETPISIQQQIQSDYDAMHSLDSLEGVTPPPLVMPVINQAEPLTAEMQARLAYCEAIPGVSLDEVRAYTYEGVKGTSSAWRLYAQGEDLVSQGQMLTDLELASIENGQQMTDLELVLLAAKGGVGNV